MQLPVEQVHNMKLPLQQQKGAVAKKELVRGELSFRLVVSASLVCGSCGCHVGFDGNCVCMYAFVYGRVDVWACGCVWMNGCVYFSILHISTSHIHINITSTHINIPYMSTSHTHINIQIHTYTYQHHQHHIYTSLPHPHTNTEHPGTSPCPRQRTT